MIFQISCDGIATERMACASQVGHCQPSTQDRVNQVRSPCMYECRQVPGLCASKPFLSDEAKKWGLPARSFSCIALPASPPSPLPHDQPPSAPLTLCPHAPPPQALFYLNFLERWARVRCCRLCPSGLSSKQGPYHEQQPPLYATVRPPSSPPSFSQHQHHV
jgi:hypothetical protein